MSLHVQLTETDRQRTIRTLTAWMTGDPEALEQVLEEVARDDDPRAANRLLFGVLSFSDYATNGGSANGSDDTGG